MITQMQQINTQESWVLYRLDKFYANPRNLEILRDIIEKNSKISLSVIDWFVTNYAKKNNTAFINSQNKLINVFLSYKSHLSAYKKKIFDPFCRTKRIKYKDIETTVGQLNFFEWLISDEILAYLETHFTEIHDDMEMYARDPSGRKKHTTSNVASKCIHIRQT